MLGVVVGVLAGWPSAAQAQPTLRVSLDCSQCDFTNLRQDITYISYVNDKSDADVYVLISTENTASGGREYRMEFMGQGDAVSFATPLLFCRCVAACSAFSSGSAIITMPGPPPYGRSSTLR